MGSADGRPTRIAAVGTGYWGKNLVRNFTELGALAAVCDADPATAAALGATHGAPAKTWSSILADTTIAGVAIAAPAVLHAELTAAALEAGKHVFVEKPLALTVAEAEQLTELAARCNRRLMIGHLLQYHPAFIRLKELVHGGALGRLQFMQSNRLNLGKIRTEEDILWSFAPHDISMILSLIGQEPVRVTAEGGFYLNASTADMTMAVLSFAGGQLAHVFVSWLHPFKEQKLVVVGDRAMAVFDDGQPWDTKLVLYPHRIEWRGNLATPQRADAQPVPVDAGEPLRLECRHFLDCIASGAAPRTDGAEAVRVLRVLAAASASLKRSPDAPQPQSAAASA